MPAVRLKGINTVHKRLADGTVATYYYHRRTGKRLRGEPGTGEFSVSLAEAEKLAPDRLAGTIAGLIKDFRTSKKWDKYRNSTREIMSFNLDAAERKFGAVPLDLIDRDGFYRDVADWRDKLSGKTPRAADAKVSALKTVFSWGAANKKIKANPIANMERVYRADRSDIIWLPEHVEAFEERAPAELRNLLTVALHTGQRRGDIFALTWNQYDGRAITLRQSKTRARVYLPCTEALRSMLDSLPRRQATILLDARNKPWTPATFRTVWDKTLAGLPTLSHLHFHDARGTAVTMLSEAGCTPQEIAAITGHTLAGVERILEAYLARTRPLAESAIRKLEEHRRNKSCKPSCKPGSSKTS